MFEVCEIIKARVRRHHKKMSPGSMVLRAICRCGSHHGGPRGTEACVRLERVLSAIINLEAELGRWEMEEPDEPAAES